MCTDVLDVNGSSDDLDIVERELGALGHDVAVHRDHWAAIVVESVAITPLLICVQVYSTKLERSLVPQLPGDDDLTFNIASLISSTRV